MADLERSSHLDEQPARTADRLHSVAIHLLRYLRKQDVVSGLSAPRLSALSVIVFGGPLTLGALATIEQVRPPSITRIVAALEADGLVTREPGSTDRREVLVRATLAGTKLLEAGRARRVEVLTRQLAALPPADLSTLKRAAAILDVLTRGPE